MGTRILKVKVVPDFGHKLLVLARLAVLAGTLALTCFAQDTTPLAASAQVGNLSRTERLRVVSAVRHYSSKRLGAACHVEGSLKSSKYRTLYAPVNYSSQVCGPLRTVC